MSLESMFAPPIETDVLVRGKSVSVSFARVDWEEWVAWEKRIKKDIREELRDSLREAGDVPDAALVKYPAEQTAKRMPLAEIAATVANSADYAFDLLIEQAIAAGTSKEDARTIVRAIPSEDRTKLAIAVTNEEFKQEAGRPLLVPLTRNPPTDPQAAIKMLEDRIKEIQKSLAPTGRSSSDDSASAGST